MRIVMTTAFLLAASLATGASPSQFAGKWQSRISRVTKKSAITVNIVEVEKN
jgi:hypothetical protein